MCLRGVLITITHSLLFRNSFFSDKNCMRVVILNAKEHEAPRMGRFGSIAFIFLYHGRLGKSRKRGEKMARHYKHINFSDFSGRREFAALYQANARPADIAGRLGVTTAAIYRELKRGETVGEDGRPVLDRNRRRAYTPVVAQQKVQVSFRRRGRTPVDGPQGGFDGDAV